MAFDATYLTTTLSQLCLLPGGSPQYGLVGGVWEVDSGKHCWIDLESDADVDIKGTPRASTMVDFLCWDPTAAVKTPLSAASLPMHSKFGGVHSEKRGQWCVLEMVGRVMESSGRVIRGFVYDQHGSHMLVRKVSHGQLDGVNFEDVQKLPFWSSIRHVPMPPHCLPRLPIQLCFFEKEVVYSMPGPCV